MKKLLIEYSSNNSGGGWWLEDKDWIALEKAGWHVIWGGNYFCGERFEKIPEGKKNCGKGEKCRGHRKFESAKEVGKNRWLGALAIYAQKEFNSMEDAIKEFEEITGQNESAEGCNCCGRPHRFDVINN